MESFRVRLNCIDHYQATPTRYDPQLRKDYRASQAAKEPKLPVVRIFGSTESGQKVCAHIHGAFPYLYVEYQGPLERKLVSEFILKLHVSIDQALAVNYRRDRDRDRPRFVARITLVKGVPFYGFHVGYRFYLKIYMLNPLVMTRLADLLQQGLIMNRKFQPYEAHLQFLLQFMADYNLYGCDYLEANNAGFRSPIPAPAGPDDPPRIWDSNTIPYDLITDELELPRSSHCAIEVDICVQDILNRKEVKERPLHHGFIEREHPLPSDIKLVHSMAGLWKDETKRRKKLQGNATAGSSPFPPEVLVSMSANPRHSSPPPWINAAEHRVQLHQLIQDEVNKEEYKELTFSNYVQPLPLEDDIRTTLQSVEDMFPETLLRALGLEEQLLAANPDVASNIEIDEQKILELEVGEEAKQLFSEESEEDKTKKANQTTGPGGSKIHVPKGQYAPDLKEIEAIATIQRTVNGLGRGVIVSGNRIGARPRISTSGAVIREFERLMAKSAEDGSGPKPAPQNNAKRRSATQPDSRRSKRPKLRHSKSDAGVLEQFRFHAQVLSNTEDSGKSALIRPPQTPQPKSAVRGNSQKQTKHATLSFPVVKDPRNPHTQMRLSQQNGPSKGDKETPKKHVAFDVAMSIRGPQSSQKKRSSIRTADDSRAKPKAAKRSPVPRYIWDGPTTMFLLLGSPPTAQDVLSTMQHCGLPDVIYQDAFYGQDKDVPPRPREYAGKEYRLDGNTLPYLPDFDPKGESPATYGVKPEQGPDLRELEASYERQRGECTLRSWEIAAPSPSFREVSQWWNDKTKNRDTSLGKSDDNQSILANTQSANPYLMSQIIGATPKNKHGFKYSQKTKSTSVQYETLYMSTMSLELHVNTRGKLVPNPEEDEIQCLFWCVRSDEQVLFGGSQVENGTLSGIIVLSEDGVLAEKIRKQMPSNVEVAEESTELELMNKIVEIVRTHDPDILTGYEVHGSSWGYLMERAGRQYEYDLCNEFSRMKWESPSFGKSGREADRWGFNTTSMIHVTGRHVINVWRAMRGELNLLQYTMENVVWHLLHRRIPHFSWKDLTEWYSSGRPRDLTKVLRYHLKRTKMNIEILEANELIPRTSEQARLLGVDFFSVFSRGSQFKVESIMFRIAKPENFVLISPSRKQVGSQNALECLPLVMEPQSNFYTSPVLVLDFQSLYPSVMIAYNYCYSTCLGRIVNWRGTSKMGFTEYKRREGLLKLLEPHINIAPNGMMYCKPNIRKSLLAKMLTEILETRVMVKSGMKQDKDDKTLQQLLNNRQLALKLLANVTYGYTSASFSGRMPCSEIADSIVQTGRETLERAIAYIHSVARWRADVVYGDTDSLFVHLPGRTREQAFAIGAEIAKEITDMNPRPMKLKFEKVYQPCVLLAKKRYVGYKYEFPGQKVPELDAKGIETVRRDGTPAEQKVEEKALRILFETADLSKVKEYFQTQCLKIMTGSVSVQDFCFAREVKLGTYSAKGPGPAGALIAGKKMAEDVRAEPQYGERVPYVVATGAPGARLIDRCIAPEELLERAETEGLELDADYYIEKNLVPPLERIFNLVGANVRSWYDEIPKVQAAKRAQHQHTESAGDTDHNADDENDNGKGKKTMEYFLASMTCLACGVKLEPPVMPALGGVDDEIQEGSEGDEGGEEDEERKDEEEDEEEEVVAKEVVEDGEVEAEENDGEEYDQELGEEVVEEAELGKNRAEEEEEEEEAEEQEAKAQEAKADEEEEKMPLCGKCKDDQLGTIAVLQARLNSQRKGYNDLVKICQSCIGLGSWDGGEHEIKCDSRDCPVFYSRVRQRAKVQGEGKVLESVITRLGEKVDKGFKELDW
ncbi:putative DNA polymerase zeta catalytic subunit [Triangularia verruculosa]|uniref:DNA polymerase n=1 Tax=Triangularia verruculosa TaxID=2587418 RepID=A0AAN6XE56_9PEZI|nr:putative DNA polymerase zeta catalytic subunit [Triangularia verruculosa]